MPKIRSFAFQKPDCSSNTAKPNPISDSVIPFDDESDREVISGCEKVRNSDEDDIWCREDDLKIMKGSLLISKVLDKASKLLKKQFSSLKGL